MGKRKRYELLVKLRVLGSWDGTLEKMGRVRVRNYVRVIRDGFCSTFVLCFSVSSFSR